MLLTGFSLMSHKDFRGPDSPINSCMWDFAGYVARVQPLIAVFESVQQAYKQGLVLMRNLRAKVEHKTGERWDLYHVLHNNASIGGAAIRKRYFWVISRIPFGVERVPLLKMPTLTDVIGDLSDLGVTWESQPYRQPPSFWSRPRRSLGGSVDGMACRTTPGIRRHLDLFNGVEWNPKEPISVVARRHYEQHGKLPDSWSEKMQEKLPRTDFAMGFHQVTRWHPERAARVTTGGAVDMIVHPTIPRMITHREVARIQGFPDDWLIRPMRGVSGLHMMWGKGIPCDCGKWIGTWIRESILGRPGSYTGDPGEQDREYVIDITNDYRQITNER